MCLDLLFLLPVPYHDAMTASAEPLKGVVEFNVHRSLSYVLKRRIARFHSRSSGISSSMTPFSHATVSRRSGCTRRPIRAAHCRHQIWRVASRKLSFHPLRSNRHPRLAEWNFTTAKHRVGKELGRTWKAGRVGDI